MASVDFLDLPEPQQLAFYGALFAMAASDGEVSSGELRLVFEAVDLSRFSQGGKDTLRSWLVQPPELEPCLDELANGSRELRYGVLMHLTDVALADERFRLGEKRALRQVRQRLGISREQGLAIEEFVWEMRDIRDRGLSDHALVESVKEAASGLAGVGVPSAALYFSGSFLGLGKGALAGVAALGMGFGMVPGLGLAVVVGAASYVALNLALDIGNHRRREKLARDYRQRGHRLIDNLGRSLDQLKGQLNEELEEGQLVAVRQRLETLEQLLDEL